MMLMIVLALYCVMGAFAGVSYFGELGKGKYLLIPLSTFMSAVMLYKLIFSGEKVYIVVLGVIFYAASLIFAALVSKDFNKEPSN